MAGNISKSAAAKMCGWPVSAIEGIIRSGAVETRRIGAEVVLTPRGAEQLREIQAHARATVAAEQGSATGPERPAASTEDPGDPATWSEVTIQAMGKKIADSLRGANPDPTMPQGIERITLRGGR